MSRPNPLKAAAAADGVTLKQVAADVGCSPESIYLVSSGRLEPWPKLRSALAARFGRDVFATEVSS